MSQIPKRTSRSRHDLQDFRGPSARLSSDAPRSLCVEVACACVVSIVNMVSHRRVCRSCFSQVRLDWLTPQTKATSFQTLCEQPGAPGGQIEPQLCLLFLPVLPATRQDNINAWVITSMLQLPTQTGPC